MTSSEHTIWKTLLALLVATSLIGAVVGAAVYFALSTREALPASEQDSNVVDGDEEVRTDAPLFISTMTHMEGRFTDDVDQDVFNEHVTDLRYAMDLYDEYGAKMTVESEQSFAKANTTWGLNFLQEIIDRGHGVGTHADFGAQSAIPLGKYVMRFAENKALIDALVGEENNRGVSGGFGPGDWVTAASRAGFDYMDGVTGFAYLSMPESERPSGWTEDYIRTTAYHDPIPPDLNERIYFFDLENSSNLTPDEKGVLTISGGELGEIQSLGEGRSNCVPNCTFDESDIDVIIDSIEQAIANRDTSRVAKINMHIPPSVFVEENEELLRAFFEAVAIYVERGELQWTTQLEAYEYYEDWENISH